MKRAQVWLAVALLAVLAVAAVGYVQFAAAREADKADRAATESGLPEVAAPTPAATPAAGGPAGAATTAHEPEEASAPGLLTVNRSPGADYGTVVELDADGTVTRFGDLTCERLHVGTEVGACLVPTPQQAGGELNLGIEGTELVVFATATGELLGTHPVSGRPSRLRMSRDDRYAGYTTFVTGHSYAVASNLFSTNPVIVDLRSGVHHPVEAFQVVDQEGRLVDDPTRNYWGITFSPRDSDTFYVALGIGEQNWIVEGSVSGRSGRIIADGMMCPSASPDGRYLVGRDLAIGSRYAIYDLADGTRRPLAEELVVDDQVEWLDERTVTYAVARPDSPADQPVHDVWSLDVTTGERTQVAIAASSPAALPSPS